MEFTFGGVAAQTMMSSCITMASLPHCIVTRYGAILCHMSAVPLVNPSFTSYMLLLHSLLALPNHFVGTAPLVHLLASLRSVSTGKVEHVRSPGHAFSFSLYTDT